MIRNRISGDAASDAAQKANSQSSRNHPDHGPHGREQPGLNRGRALRAQLEPAGIGTGRDHRVSDPIMPEIRQGGEMRDRRFGQRDHRRRAFQADPLGPLQHPADRRAQRQATGADHLVGPEGTHVEQERAAQQPAGDERDIGRDLRLRQRL